MSGAVRRRRAVVTGAGSFIGRAVVGALLKAGIDVAAVVRPGSESGRALQMRYAEGSGNPGAAHHGQPGMRGAEDSALCHSQSEIRHAGNVQTDAAAQFRLPFSESEEQETEALRRGTGAFTLLPCDLAELAGLTAAPALAGGADFWLHLGWEGAGSANRANPDLQARNIGYALDALRTAAALGCSRFLFTGSQAEYGICSGPMREDQPCSPVSEYGKCKTAVRIQAEAEAARLGISYLHTRIFSVYGPGDHPWSLVESCMDAFLSGGHMALGPCTQQWNFLYVEDAALALTQLLVGKAPGGVYNVAGEDTRPLRAYIEELYRLCGGAEQGASYTFGDRPPNAEGQVSLMPDIGKLKRATGFAPQVSFAEGIGRMLRARKI